MIKIECLFPWDIDSNPGDNEIRKVLTGGEVGEEEIDVIESFIAAARCDINFIFFSMDK